MRWKKPTTTLGCPPERINPGDKVHRLDTVDKVCELMVEAGIHRAKVAMVIESSQRDINIAFVNELSIIFNKMGIDTKAVLAVAGTEWNFLKFIPGLVGDHCIGVDPYYLTHICILQIWAIYFAIFDYIS